MAVRHIYRTESALRQAGRPGRRAVLLGFSLLLGLLATVAGQPLRAQTAATEAAPLPPLALPEPPAAAKPPAGPEVARLKEAFKQMTAENPVVARVNGHEIRWAEVAASAGDLPERYRDQLESVFPALLDRLVDLRLLADAARAQGFENDPKVRERVAAYEERVLSSALLDHYLAEQVTVASLRKRYDALVAARRGDREVRARHILVESEDEAASIIDRLDHGAVFISLATELSKGSSASHGGDLGYFHPSRMPPAFAKALLALEPGEYTKKPVHTDFGWDVILLVDRRADNIPSFLDMQDKLREEAKKAAIDRLLLDLRQQATLEMFPGDARGAVAGGSK